MYSSVGQRKMDSKDSMLFFLYFPVFYFLFYRVTYYVGVMSHAFTDKIKSRCRSRFDVDCCTSFTNLNAQGEQVIFETDAYLHTEEKL